MKSKDRLERYRGTNRRKESVCPGCGRHGCAPWKCAALNHTGTSEGIVVKGGEKRCLCRRLAACEPHGPDFEGLLDSAEGGGRRSTVLPSGFYGRVSTSLTRF